MEYIKLFFLGVITATTLKLFERGIYFCHWDYYQKKRFYMKHHKKIGEEISEIEAREMAYMAVGGKTLIDLWDHNEKQEKTLVKLD